LLNLSFLKGIFLVEINLLISSVGI
jgi:hypothetical protein